MWWYQAKSNRQYETLWNNDDPKNVLRLQLQENRTICIQLFDNNDDANLYEDVEAEERDLQKFIRFVFVRKILNNDF